MSSLDAAGGPPASSEQCPLGAEVPETEASFRLFASTLRWPAWPAPEQLSFDPARVHLYGIIDERGRTSGRSSR